MIATATLTALVGLDPARAEIVLCRAIDALLPNVDPVELDTLERDLLQEARAVGGGSNDSAATEVLTEALASYLLPAEKETATRNRLGTQGDLPLGMYEVVFSWPGEILRDVSRDEVRACIENASFVDHLTGSASISPTTERTASAAEVLFRGNPMMAAEMVELGLQVSWPEDAHKIGATLVASRVQSHPRGKHWLLLIMKREATVLTVDYAWRVFDDTLPPGRISGTRAIFQALLAEVGMSLALPGNRKRLLYWKEEILFGKDVGEYKPAHHGPQVTKLYSVVTPEKIWCVLLAFSIDIKRYKNYIDKHVVRP